MKSPAKMTRMMRQAQTNPQVSAHQTNQDFLHNKLIMIAVLLVSCFPYSLKHLHLG